MKYIISLLLLFSSIFSVNAQDNSRITTVLNLNYGVESFDLENAILDPIDFQNQNIEKTYNEFKTLNTTLKSVLIEKYENNEINYYDMNDAVRSYKNFIYYTNNAFYYVSMQEKGFREKHVENAIVESYSLMRLSYIEFVSVLD